MTPCSVHPFTPSSFLGRAFTHEAGRGWPPGLGASGEHRAYAAFLRRRQAQTNGIEAPGPNNTRKEESGTSAFVGGSVECHHSCGATYPCYGIGAVPLM